MVATTAFDPLRKGIQIGILAILAVLVAMLGAGHIAPLVLAAAFFLALKGYLPARPWKA